MKHLCSAIIIMCFVFVFSSCAKNDDIVPEGYTSETGYTYGTFVVNEGTFNSVNGSITYFDPITGLATNDIFSANNSGAALGDVAQSFSVANGRGYIVLNNSKKIQVIDLKSFKSLAEIKNLSYPRYLYPVNENVAYVTNGNFAGKVYVIDLKLNKVTDSVSVGKGPETMVKVSSSLYVANSGGWDIDNTISVIDLTTNKLKTTINCNVERPIEMVIDANQNIWAICQGNFDWFTMTSSTDSRLVCINPSTNTIIKSVVIGSKTDSYTPQRLAVSNDGRTLYYIEKNGLYKMDIDATVSPATTMISGSFYGVDVNPANGTIYVFDAGDFASAGKMSVYRPDGSLIYKDIKVGIVPSGASFN